MWAKQFSIIDPFYVYKYICVWIQCVIYKIMEAKHWKKNRSSTKNKTINVLKLLTKVMKSLKFPIDFIYFSHLTSNNYDHESSWKSFYFPWKSSVTYNPKFLSDHFSRIFLKNILPLLWQKETSMWILYKLVFSYWSN